MSDEFKQFSLTVEEYNELETELGLFKEFLLFFTKHPYTSISLQDIYGIAPDGATYIPKLTANFRGIYRSKESWQISESYAYFGCFLMVTNYIYFPLPLVISTEGDCSLWRLPLYDIAQDVSFLTAMSVLYKKRVPKRDLFDELSVYFGRGLTAKYLGLSSDNSYAAVLRSILSMIYSYNQEKQRQEEYILTRTIYDLWDKLLTSKGVLNLEPVKKLWGMTRYKTQIETWEAIRELAYIESDTPSILTYTNLYEKGIESDFGQAILKNLKDKKEAESLEKTLSPMEMYIAREKGFPYKVPETGKDVINFIDYKKIYQSVLYDILRKLKVVGG